MVSNVSLSLSNLGKVWNYGKRVLEVTPELIFGSASEAMGDTFRRTSGSVFDKAKAGWHTLEKAGSGSFFSGLWKNFKTFIPCIKSNIQNEVAAARFAGKNTFFAGTKGLFKGLGKKMPFIGAVSMMLFELPNIWKATVEQGIFQGAAEGLKSGARLTGGGLGAAIGSALIPIPFVGSMCGWIAGEWLASRIVGKSYSEKKSELEQMAQKQTQEKDNQQNEEQIQQPQTNPFWINQSQGQTSFSGEQVADTNSYIPNPMSQIPAQPAINPMATTQMTMPVVTNIPQNMPMGMYNPFSSQAMPYANDVMYQQMQLNRQF